MAAEFYDGFATTQHANIPFEMFNQVPNFNKLTPQTTENKAKTTLTSPYSKHSPVKGPAFVQKKEIKFGALINNKRASNIR